MELTAIAAWLNTACAGLDAAVTGAVAGLYDAAGGFFTPFSHFMDLMGKAAPSSSPSALRLSSSPKQEKQDSPWVLPF